MKLPPNFSHRAVMRTRTSCVMISQSQGSVVELRNRRGPHIGVGLAYISLKYYHETI